MIKLLYSISLLVLIPAGFLFVLSVTQWGQDSSGNQDNSETSIVERYKTLDASGGRNNRNVTSPLVKQATVYALYLDPPKPPAPKIAPRPTVHAQPVNSVNRTVEITPKFRLLATTYYRSSPDKSLALVSEPGKGDHWVKKGERMGHFLLERVEKDGISYRDGNQTREMKVTKAGTVQVAQIKSSLSVPAQSIKPNLRLMNTSLSSEVE